MSRKDTIKNLIFVCVANMCRSPMAEGLAKNILGSRVKISSAGLAPFSKNATREAVEILKEFYGIDISEHCPKPVTDLDLNRVDLIIGLYSTVYRYLSDVYPHLSEKILLWEIEDPFGKDMKAYKETAEIIQNHIKKYLV